MRRSLWAEAYWRPPLFRVWFRFAERGKGGWDRPSLPLGSPEVRHPGAGGPLPASCGSDGAHEAEAQVVVAIRRVVPVAIGGAEVVLVVVPVAAPVDAVGARLFSTSPFFIFYYHRLGGRVRLLG